MDYPLISIAIAIFNSQKMLAKTLESIRQQTYPQNKIEILAIDGGSIDETLQIAKKYKCKIFKNPRTELVFAKHIGFMKANGEYLMFLDHDEILENHRSLKLKYSAFKKDRRIKAVMPSGYKTPSDYPPINYYINEFGDPFSFFVYRKSANNDFIKRNWSDNYKKVYEDKNCIVISFLNTKSLPLIELWAGGCMIDLQYARSTFSITKKDPTLIANLFYLFNNQGTLVAVTKKDYTIHYSSKSIGIYLKKLNSRVKNSINQTPMGRAGFLGREKFNPFWFRLKKYLFIPYTLLILPAMIDSIYFTVTRKKLLYLVHLPLCIYITFLMVYYLFLKKLGIKPKATVE